MVTMPEPARVARAPTAATSGPPSAVPSGAAGTVNIALAAATGASTAGGVSRWMTARLNGRNGP